IQSRRPSATLREPVPSPAPLGPPLPEEEGKSSGVPPAVARKLEPHGSPIRPPPRLLDRRGRCARPDRGEFFECRDPAPAGADGVFLEARRARNAGARRE